LPISHGVDVPALPALFPETREGQPCVAVALRRSAPMLFGIAIGSLRNMSDVASRLGNLRMTCDNRLTGL